MQDQENFRAVVAASDLLRERWLTLSSTIIAECADSFGETIDRESLMALNSVRLAVLTGDDFDWRAEAQQQLPALKRATELAEIKRRIEEEDAQAVFEEFDGLSGPERLAKARELGICSRAEDNSKPTLEQQSKEAARINGLNLSPQQRMAEARRAGLEH